MHEISYCEGVLDAVLRRANGRPVSRIGVRAGTLHRLVPAAFEQSFQLVAGGTIAEGASTEVVPVPATAVCRACTHRTDTAGPIVSCPSCGGFEVDLEGGTELVLAWVEYAEPVAAPHPRRERTAALIPEHTHEGA
ncbi:MAG TPA: hydrogenase maturation nickel metallochaperone HypA [Frankiaceae bacterium]|nr:hydrogenase maturation nickel metallochaperone HypA [Frankiaceae bacterium]